MEIKDRKQSGRPVTSGLFLEEYTKGLDNPDAIFTTQREDRHGCRSLYKLYIQHCDDPTELTFVHAVFDGDTARWEAIRKCRIMKPIYDKWLADAHRQRLHNTVQHLIKLAADTSNPKNQLAATVKLLAFQEKYQKEQAVNKVEAAKKSAINKTVTSEEDKLGASILAALGGDDEVVN